LRSGTRGLRKFVRLPAAERRLLVKAALLLAATRAGVWLLPFRTVRRVVARVADAPAGFRSADGSSVDEVVRAVGRAGRLLSCASTCLTEALVAQVLLARRGHPASLRIGVARSEGGQFEAHAWVESDGMVMIGGNELGRYAPLAALGADMEARKKA
jgi:Transglutaminase-like superfamily